jgi:hypothetical protein
MSVEITSGPARVLSAGTVTSFAGASVSVRVEQPEGALSLVLRFRTDPTVADVAVAAEHGPSGVSLELTNFDRADGRGSAHPVLVGQLDSDLVMAHFRVHRYGRTPDRTVHFTIYRVSAAAVQFDVGPGGPVAIVG